MIRNQWIRKRILGVLAAVSLVLSGCGEDKSKGTRINFNRTSDQKQRAKEILVSRELFTYEESPLLGKKVADEKELLSLADVTFEKDELKIFAFAVRSAEHALDGNAPAEEGDIGFTVFTHDGIITKVQYAVAEF